MTWALATASRSFTIVWTSINTLKTLKRISKTDQGATVSEYKKNVQVCADVLTIWTVFGCIVVWETYLEFLVVWIPGYYYFKSFVLIISSFPTIRVSNLAFYYAVVPMLDAVNDCIGSHYMPSSPLALLRVLPLLTIAVLFPHLVSEGEEMGGFLDPATSGQERSRADAVFERVRAKRARALSNKIRDDIGDSHTEEAGRTRRVSKPRSSIGEPHRADEAPSFSTEEIRASEVDEQFLLIPDYRDSFGPPRESSASFSSPLGAAAQWAVARATNIAAESNKVLLSDDLLDEDEQLVFVDGDRGASLPAKGAEVQERVEAGSGEALSSGLDDADGGLGGQWDWVVSSPAMREQSSFSQTVGSDARTKSGDRDVAAWTSAESVSKSLETANPPPSTEVEEEPSAPISVPRRFTSGTIKVSTSQANLLRGSGRRLSALAEIYPAITHAAASHSSSHHRSVGATSEGRSIYASPESITAMRRRSLASIPLSQAVDELSGAEGTVSPLHSGGIGSSPPARRFFGTESTPTKTPPPSSFTPTSTPLDADRHRTPASASSLSPLAPGSSPSPYPSTSLDSADENKDPAGDGRANPSQFVSTVRSLWTGDSKLSIRDTIRSTLDLHKPSPNSVIRSRRTIDYLRLSQTFGKAVLGSDSPRPLTSPPPGKTGSSASPAPAPSAAQAAAEPKSSGARPTAPAPQPATRRPFK